MYTGLNQKITEWARISPSYYLKCFLNELSEMESNKIIINNLGVASQIKLLLNSGVVLSFKSLQKLHNGFCDWYRQGVDFVPSNLGRGYVWYFLCNKCDRRAKFLYYREDFAGYASEPLCRICGSLQYTQPGRKERRISKAFKKFNKLS
jgi:hypothetical protein